MSYSKAPTEEQAQATKHQIIFHIVSERFHICALLANGNREKILRVMCILFIKKITLAQEENEDI